jgi:pilus assembly protein FimV
MRAKPIFRYSVLAAALALPGPVLALGLGKLTVDSGLGQPLSARIELTSVTKEDLDSLRAKVADPSLYRQNNLTYQSALSRARISVEGGSGTPYLRVTSPISVQEPFLDLLVELDWASGRVVREYTFLLDPPGMPALTAAEPVTPARAGTPARTSPAPAARAPAPVPAPATAVGSGGAPSAGGGEQYTVRRGDTLRGIASQYKPTEVTIEQMLAALFQGNQAAFEGGNMNRLRAGAIVTIPTAADATATPAAEAARVVRMQASDWRNYRDRVAAAAPESAGGASREAGGRIGAAVEDRTPAAAPGSDKLRVSREAGTGKGAGAAEDAIARDQQLRDAQSRIAALEKTIAEMQRAVELKNQTLAQLQAQADAARGKAPETTTASAATATAPAATTTAASTAAPAPAAPAAPAPAAPETKAATESKAAPETKAAAEPAPAKAPAPKAQPAPKAEPPGFFADLFSSTPNWAIGAAALAILGGIAALIAARRRKGTKFEDSIISGTDIKTNTVFGSTGGGVVNTGDNSLASDFSREGLGNIDTDEVDPIAEAEVYLAYGRDAQAEEILKDALKKDPQRQEIYLKLLEIHSQHNKPQAFETVASELFAVSHGQGDVWHKAVTLGRQLDPANPMFQDGGAVQPAAAAPAAVASAPPAPPRSPLHAAPAFNDGDISITPPAAPKSAADILAGAEDALARSATTPVAAATAAAQGPRASATETTGAAAAGVAGAVGAAKTSFAQAANDLSTRVDTPAEPPRFDLDFQLDELDRPPPKAAAESKTDMAAAAPFGHPAAPLELDKLDLSFNPDRPAFDDPTPSVLDGQWHDAATKLDLAKAYQEMGDTDGAREILQEVLHEGDDQQKSEAQGLLAKLAS